MAQFYEALFKEKGGAERVAVIWWEVFDKCTPAQKVRLLSEIGASIKDLYDRNVTRNAEEDDPTTMSDEELLDHMEKARAAREATITEVEDDEPEFSI